MIQVGSTGSTTCAKGELTSIPVTFPTPFSKAPFVVITMQSGSNAAGCGSIAYGINNSPSTTGFTLNVWNNDSSDRTPTFRWIAISA